MNPLKAFQKRLGYKFRKSDLLEAALTHPSHRYEITQGEGMDNQRLEFLGDAVLGLLAANALYSVSPELQEGEMTQLRSRISNRDHLATLGRRWELGPLLKLGKGESRSGGSERDSNLADAVEAVIGAVYLDGGIKAVRKLFDRHLAPDMAELHDAVQTGDPVGNPKGQLQEWTQKQNGQAPFYEIISEEGPQHDRSYRAAVSWDGRQLATGSAPSKRAAEARAAENALNEILQGETFSR
jgi:ribonuclease-3